MQFFFFRQLIQWIILNFFIVESAFHSQDKPHLVTKFGTL